MTKQIYRKRASISDYDPSIPLTTEQCAEISGLSPRRIRQFIASGRLKATRSGRQWLVKLWDLAEFDEIPRKIGNPHGPRRRRRKRLNPGFVYIAQDSIGRIKIGQTIKEPEERIGKLRTQIGMDVYLLAARRVRDMDIAERALQEALRESWTGIGEWYLPDKDGIKTAEKALIGNNGHGKA